MPANRLKKKLDALYNGYNKPDYVHPDPLEFLYDYEKIEDREIVGLIASSLAYGRVVQILKSVSLVLNKMGRSPLGYVKKASPKSLKKDFSVFTHRFASVEHMTALFLGMKQVIKDHGSLYEGFLSGFKSDEDTILHAITTFARNLTQVKGHSAGHLIPLPERGSACKRLNLFLRWMVRKDDVDPGGWDNIPTSKLIIPLDVHMHRAGLQLGFTDRKQGNMRTALEITEGFKKIAPEDPVRYDFALTRLGIRGDENLENALQHSWNK